MRKISASWIFPGNKPPLKNGILVCEDDGTILDLIDTCGQLREIAGLEQYSGILMPGFVNAHCHPELSHLKGEIPERTGLGGFLGVINKLRNTILSIHIQESLTETEFFKYGTGSVFNHLSQTLGLDVSQRKPAKKSSTEFALSFIPAKNQLLLVHNTFITQQDIDLIKKLRRLENTFFVLCPNANLYNENQVPPVLLFKKEKLNICLGTDSLASNHNLSVLQEMITLQNHFPEITLQELVEWGCLNGARALGLSDLFGSFEPGKKPGVNLITGADLQNQMLKTKSKVKRLL